MTENEFKRLVPIMTSDGKRMRSPMRVLHKEDRYTICVSDGKYRYFTSDTVPDEIKAAIAMIRAFPEDVRTQRGPDMNYYVPPDPRLADIGWQLDDRTYIVLLEHALLHALWWPGPFTKDRSTWQTRQNER